MATKTWWLRQINVGGTNPNRLWWDGDPAAGLVTQATSVTGWNVGTVAANNYADLNQGTEVARGTFATTILPNATAPTVDNSYAATATFTPPTLLSSTDSILTLYEYNGYFPAGNWVFTFPVIAVTLGGTQDGAITMRVFKAPRSGTAFGTTTELTAALQQGTTVTNLTTAATQSSVVTWAAPAFSLNNEFLICKIGWRIIGAGGGNNADVALRYGSGCTMVSPNFRKRNYNIT
jgi:hypothetical protein